MEGTERDHHLFLWYGGSCSSKIVLAVYLNGIFLTGQRSMNRDIQGITSASGLAESYITYQLILCFVALPLKHNNILNTENQPTYLTPCLVWSMVKPRKL